MLSEPKHDERVLAFRELIDNDGRFQAHPLGELTDALAVIQYTGGTTGTPKLVRHTHANQVYQAWAMNLLFKSRPGANLLFGLPLFHVGSSLTQALTTLSGGGCLVVLSPAGWRNPTSIKNIWSLVERFKPEALTSVPTVLAAALAIPLGNADISSLRYAQSNHGIR